MYLRPGLLEFLEDLSKAFELVLFNNGSSLYTEAVLAKLLSTLHPKQERESTVEKKSCFSHILCKDYCSSNDKGHDIKDLIYFTGPKSNRDLRDCIIVDNSIYCF